MLDIIRTQISHVEQLQGKYGIPVAKTALANARATAIHPVVPSIETLRTSANAEVNTHHIASMVEQPYDHHMITQRVKNSEKVQSEYRTNHEAGDVHVQMLDEAIEKVSLKLDQQIKEVHDVLQVPEVRTHIKGKQPRFPTQLKEADEGGCTVGL